MTAEQIVMSVYESLSPFVEPDPFAHGGFVASVWRHGEFVYTLGAVVTLQATTHAVQMFRDWVK